MCLAKTHVACSLLGGCTLNSFTFKHLKNGSYKGWLVIDEFSLAEFRIWSMLYRLLDTCKFILVGSFHQLPPVSGHQYCDVDLPEDCLEKSRMFHRLCGGNRIELKTCMRSDSTLYDWYTSLCPQGSRYETPFEEVLKEAREFFNGTQNPDYTLCISHETRKEINRQANERLKPPEAIFVEVPKVRCPNAPQDFWIYPGQILMAHVQVSKGSVKNGMFYTVKQIKNDYVSFECGLTLPLKTVAKSFRLTHGLTISSSQGRTLPGVVEIRTRHKRLSRRHLMICLSRGTEFQKVQVR